MTLTRVVVSSLIVTALTAALFLIPASAMTTPKLVGTVGPGFTITLKKGSKKVTKLKAGKYIFVIHDKGSAHDFTLEREKGGKFEKHLSGVAFVGTKTATITLKRGTWKYYCSVHEPTMFGFVKVTS